MAKRDEIKSIFATLHLRSLHQIRQSCCLAPPDLTRRKPIQLSSGDSHYCALNQLNELVVSFEEGSVLRQAVLLKCKQPLINFLQSQFARRVNNPDVLMAIGSLGSPSAFRSTFAFVFCSTGGAWRLLRHVLHVLLSLHVLHSAECTFCCKQIS